MDTQIFLNILRKCAFLPKLLKGKLFVLSHSLDSITRSEIASELHESETRQVGIVRGGIDELKHIEKSLNKDVRVAKEEIERLQEKNTLPNFEDE